LRTEDSIPITLLNTRGSHPGPLLILQKQLCLPSHDYYRRLKTEEKIQFGSRARTSTNYFENYSASLALPFSNDELDELSYVHEALITVCKDHIVEHANRRVDLFFYTLIAYYGTNLFPALGQTYLQHGRGRHGTHNLLITEACHSSFLPSLVDETIYHNKANGKKYRCQLSDTHFLDSLSTTVELPRVVNQLDAILEEYLQCRKHCLAILRCVTLGAMNPIQGLTLFLTIMEHLLNNTNQASKKTKYSNKEPNTYSFWGYNNIPHKLIDYVAEGTLDRTFSKQNQSVSKPYIHSLLGLFPPKTDVYGSKEITEQDCLDKIQIIQKELLTKVC
jgi:hypothetical protein